MHHVQELLPRDETLMEKKITFLDNENGTSLGATSSFQANGQLLNHSVKLLLPFHLN
jgi:hypothetical protein